MHNYTNPGRVTALLGAAVLAGVMSLPAHAQRVSLNTIDAKIDTVDGKVDGVSGQVATVEDKVDDVLDQAIANNDGVLTIDQACASGPGCFPGDGAGFPVTIPANMSARLVSDLSNTDETKTSISMGDYSTLDLNGFAVVGPTTCTGIPVTSCTPNPASATTGFGVLMGDGSVLRNGTVRGHAQAGVAIRRSGRVENLLIEQNAKDGVIGNVGPVPVNAQIVDSRITRNGDDGIDLAFGGNFSAVVRGNSVYGNGDDGVRPGQRSLTADNSIYENGDRGLVMNLGVDGNAFGGNVIHSNAGGTTTGGVEIAPNVCDGNTTCP